MGRNNIQRGNRRDFSQARIATNSKKNKCKGNHTQAHHSQNFESQIQRDLKSSWRKKDTVHRELKYELQMTFNKKIMETEIESCI